MARKPTVDNDQVSRSPRFFVRFPTTEFDSILRLVALPIEIDDVADMCNADLVSMMHALDAYEMTGVTVRCTNHSVEAKLRCLGELHTMKMLTSREKEKASVFLVAAIGQALMDVEGARNRARKFDAVLSSVIFSDATRDSGSDEDHTEEDRPPQ